MPGQRGTETRIRTIALATRWSPREYRRLTEIAEYSACSRAEVLRQLVARDHRNIMPSRELVAEVRRIGNNLNQLARSVNAGKRVSKSALDDLYREMLAAVIAMRA